MFNTDDVWNRLDKIIVLCFVLFVCVGVDVPFQHLPVLYSTLGPFSWQFCHLFTLIYNVTLKLSRLFYFLHSRHSHNNANHTPFQYAVNSFHSHFFVWVFKLFLGHWLNMVVWGGISVVRDGPFLRHLRHIFEDHSLYSDSEDDGS